jgi:acyl carrier protein
LRRFGEKTSATVVRHYFIKPILIPWSVPVSETQQRLVRCFQAVFPELKGSDAARANTNSLAAWDSVATVTLAAAVEEEFGIQFEPEEIEKIDSFESCLNLLASR